MAGASSKVEHLRIGHQRAVSDYLFIILILAPLVMGVRVMGLVMLATLDSNITSLLQERGTSRCHVCIHEDAIFESLTRLIPKELAHRITNCLDII